MFHLCFSACIPQKWMLMILVSTIKNTPYIFVILLECITGRKFSNNLEDKHLLEILGNIIRKKSDKKWKEIALCTLLTRRLSSIKSSFSASQLYLTSILKKKKTYTRNQMKYKDIQRYRNPSIKR